MGSRADNLTTAQSIGRLSRPPHPELFELLYEPHFLADREFVLPHLLRIDAAHVVMLVEERILPAEVGADLLEVNRELSSRLEAGEAVLETPPRHRGFYLLYENQYIERLGKQRGGAAHVGRSRNDINATIVSLRLRGRLRELIGEGLELADVARALAAEHVDTLMSAFTHMQPAQPSSLGHYLAALGQGLTRSLEALTERLEALSHCPMGAAAGIGTSLPIAADRVAGLLGFERAAENSLDAVASRDEAARSLAELAILGTLLTRWALDFQLWGNRAHGFLDWPDELVSTSSIMPQKRNAYVWENVRGQASQSVGALMNLLLGFKNAPFTNNIENSEGCANLWPAFAATRKAVRLTRLLAANVEVRKKRMLEFLEGAETTMTALADHLVTAHGLAFRSAHDLVGRLVSNGEVASPLEIRDALARWGPEIADRPLALEEEEIRGVLEPASCLRSAAFGGGPAPQTVRGQLAALAERAAGIRSRVGAVDDRLRRAREQLDRAIDAVCQDRRGGR